MITENFRDMPAATASMAEARRFVDSPAAADPVVFLIAGVVLAALVSTGLVGAMVLGDGPHAIGLGLAGPALGLLG